MFAYEGQGSFLFHPITDKIDDPSGLFQQVTADVQADYRHVQVYAKEPVPVNLGIMMEASIKAALHFGKTTDIVVTHGSYGKPENTEQRTYYMQLRSSKYLSFMAGRFLPNYGLNIDDHTAITRGSIGFGQGDESMNVSIHFEDETFQTTFTRVLGKSLEIHSSRDRFSYESEVRDRFIIRSAIKLGNKFLGGVSGLIDEKDMYAGLFSVWAPLRYLYGMVEYDNIRQMDFGTWTRRDLYFVRTGSEVFRGLTLGLELSGEKAELFDRQRTGAFIYLTPTPHVSFRFEGRRENGLTNFIGMAHLWL